MADGAGGELGAWASFRRDLGESLAAWKKAPALPLITLAIAALVAIPGAYPRHAMGFLPILSLPVLLFSLGFNGTQRLWYLRIWRGRNLSGSEVWNSAWGYFGRFLVLALFGLLAAAPIVIVVVIATTDGKLSTLSDHAPYAFAIAAIAVVVDFVCTFVTPALAFSTADVGEAFKSGVRFLRETWPQNAWYALLPPLAFQALGRFLPQASVSSVPRLVLLCLIGPVALLLKGAAAAFYLRHHDVGDDGALRTRTALPPPPPTGALPPQPERPR